MSEKNHDPLLTSQKNEVFKAISQAGLNADDFEWKRTPEEKYDDILVDALVHKPSNFVMIFGKNREAYRAEKFFLRFSPDIDRMFGASNIYDWEGVIYEVYQWLERVQQEWEAPDLWEQASKGNFNDASSMPNTKFTKEELKIVKQRIEDVRKKLLHSVEGNDEKIKDVNSKINYLIDQSSKQGRRDWLMLVYGYIFTNVANWGLSMVDFHSILHLLITGIQTLQHAL